MEQEPTGKVKKEGNIRLSGLSEEIRRRSDRHRLQNLIKGDLRLFCARAVYNRPPACLTELASQFICCIHTAQGTNPGYIIMPSVPAPVPVNLSWWRKGADYPLQSFSLVLKRISDSQKIRLFRQERFLCFERSGGQV